jgi:nitrate/nitrite-specific signal transduction histidine kinase
LIWGLWLAMFLAFVGGWAVIRRQLSLPGSAWDLTYLLIFGGLLLLLAVVSGLLIEGLFKKSLFRPLEQLRTRVERLRQGDPAVRLRVNQDDDLGQVTAALDELVSRLRANADQRTIEAEAIRAELGQRNQVLEALEQAYGSLQRRNQLLTQILEVGHSLQRNLNPRTLFQEMVQAVHTSLGFEIVVLNLVDEDGRHVRARAHSGLDEEGRRRAVGCWKVQFIRGRSSLSFCKKGFGWDTVISFLTMPSTARLRARSPDLAK